MNRTTVHSGVCCCQSKDIVVEVMKLAGSAEEVEDTHTHHTKICFLDPDMHKSAAVIDATKFWPQVWFPHGDLVKVLDEKDPPYKRPAPEWDPFKVKVQRGLTTTKIRDVLKQLLMSKACYKHVFSDEERPKQIFNVLDPHFQQDPPDLPHCNRMWSYMLHLLCKKYGKNGEMVHEKWPTQPRFSAKPLESPASPARAEAELLGASQPVPQPEPDADDQPVQQRRKKQKTQKPQKQQFVVSLESRFAMGTNPEKAVLKQIMQCFKTIQITGAVALRVTTKAMIQPHPERLAREMSIAHVRWLKQEYDNEGHQGLNHHFYCNLVLDEKEVESLKKAHNGNMDRVFQYLRQELTDAGEGAPTNKKYQLETIGGNHSRQAKQELILDFPQDKHLLWWASRCTVIPVWDELLCGCCAGPLPTFF